MRLPLGPELRDLLGEGEEGHHKLRELLDEYHPKEAAEILNCLEPDEITQAMSLLPIQMERDMFAYFEPSLQEQIMLGSSRSRVQALLAGLPSDERAEFLEGLDDTVRQQLMPLLAREARSDLMRRDRFGDEQVGSIMSTEFCVLSEELTMPRALEELRRQAPSKETIYYSYAVDRSGKLKGFLSLRDMIMADRRLTVGDVMKCELVSVRATAHQEEAARLIREYDLLALPVLDEEDHMVGIVTHDDAVDIIDEAYSEDVRMRAGITSVEDAPEGYLASTVFEHFRGRVPWLAFLAVSFLIVAMIIKSYEETIHKADLAVAFLPLLLATGANVGGQASALILRALAVHALSHDQLPRVLWKELRVGMCLGTVLAGVAFGLTWLFATLAPTTSFDFRQSIGIATAIGVHVVTVAVVGAVVPLVISRLKVQPEVFSVPALNFLSDTVGTLIYLFCIWLLVLRGR
ncbi:MAG: magnesium transporter [Planctomycetes bacterium]|nr:magnesium transporter [Planctomycetota bacterium]